MPGRFTAQLQIPFRQHFHNITITDPHPVEVHIQLPDRLFQPEIAHLGSDYRVLDGVPF